MKWVKQEDKEFTGYSQSPTLTGPRISRRESLGSEDNWNPAQTPDTFTGKSLWAAARRNLSGEFKRSLEEPVTPNLADQKPRPRMFGRKTPESKEPSLNLEKSPSSETAPQIGTLFGNQHSEETSCPFLQTFEFIVIGLSELSALTTLNQLKWSELAMFSLVQLGLGSHDALGANPEWRLSVKIPTANSGAVTVVNQELSSMNFVVESMSHTYSAGLIVTRATWKSKDQVSHYVQNPFGLHPTWMLINGIPNWMSPRLQH